MGRISLEDAEKRLQTVKCAVCKTNNFGIDRRFVQADGECRGTCLKCRYNFPIYTDMDFYLKTQPDIPYRLREISCPACKKHGVNLDFRITMSVREAIYFVTCNSCQAKFPEQSSLEAFE
ncbi:MAG: hypothetical protein ABW047_05685 [Nitrospiraceae bacterium]